MRLILPGSPIAQTRAKFSSRGGFGRIYDPREKEKKAIKHHIKSKFEQASLPKFEHPRVSFVFHLPIPASIPKYLLPMYRSGLLKHEKKPDTDNFVKLYLDCMDTIAFDGDQKVQQGPAVKLYHPHPKTIIIIQEAEQLLSPLEVDPMTWLALFGRESGKCSYAEMDSLPDFYTPTHLTVSQSFDRYFPQQNIDSSEPIPLVRQLLEQARLALELDRRSDLLH